MNNLWIHSKKFDSFFYIYSGLLCLILIIPYLLWQADSIWPIYNFYLIAFGLPHNFLTWATLLPKDAKKSFKLESINNAFIFCIVLCALIPFVKGSNLGDWVLSFVAYFSLWHAYRQHHGIARIYDAVQMKRSNDTTLNQDRKPLYLFFGLAANSIVVWAFTHQKINYLLSPDDSHELIHPVIPWNLFQVYVFITCVIGIYALKKVVFDRYRRNVFIPWPQLQLMFVAILTYVIPYFFIPIEAIPVPVAIATMFHNIQYFGFVWSFEKSRSIEMQSANEILGIPQKLAITNNWMGYFSLAFFYSILIVVFYIILPKGYGLALVYFTGIAHYIIDGYLWRGDINMKLKNVVSGWAK